MEKANFVLCVKNDGCEDLEIRKIYQVLPDEPAEKADYFRIIDESGEDYLYPRDYFFPVQLPKAAEEVLLQAA